MKAKITAFINELITYDYILFGGVFVLFVLFLILGIVLRRKVGIAVIFVLFAFIILFVGPTLGYVEMHKYLFKSSVELKSQKKLTFTNAIVVKGILKNESKKNFKSCKITAKIYKVSKNKLKTYIYSLKAIKKMTISQNNIMIGDSKGFKMIIEPFTYSKDYNISLSSRCK